jgi:hypothetical protein
MRTTLRQLFFSILAVSTLAGALALMTPQAIQADNCNDSIIDGSGGCQPFPDAYCEPDGSCSCDCTPNCGCEGYEPGKT